MQQGMCPYIKEHSLGLPRCLGRLRGGPSLRLRHPGDALNLRLLLLHCSALKPPLLQSVLRPRRRARRVDAWVVEVLPEGYRILFSRRPQLSNQPLPMPSYSPSSIRGKALEQEFQYLLHKQVIEPAPQAPGFYSRLFVVQKDSGAWRPIIGLSTLDAYIASQRFHMETPQSVLRSIRPGDWMISLDLQDAYLQVPVHLESRRYLRFTMGGVSYQFRVLCFWLTTAPQVFTRLMAPISAILHRYGIRMLRYLGDWLILAESRTTCLQVRDKLLQVCEELGLQVNLRKSSLIPSQDMTYLSMQIQSVRFIAKPTETRVVNLLKIIEDFLSSPDPPAALWRRLLGHLSSLTLLVKGGMLRMLSLQIRLRSRWDFRDELLRIPWDPLCQEDLLWWSWAIQRREGVDLSLPVPDLWRRLLGHLSSLTLLVKGGMLRMRSLQIRLRSRWDFRDELLCIPWDPLCQEDLLWWSWAIQRREGVDLSLPVPDLRASTRTRPTSAGAPS